MDPRIDEVIDEWFGPGGESSAGVSKRWFTKDPAYDAELRRKLGALHGAAVAGKLDGWRHTARGELALIVLLDQLSRNLHRNDARAFASDAVALELARDLLRTGRARELTVPQRMIACMPFEHAEDRSAQAEGIAAFSALLDHARAEDPGTVDLIESALDYARRHAAIIERFGRFPHRNAALGRVSTEEEEAFLQQPGSSF